MENKSTLYFVIPVQFLSDNSAVFPYTSDECMCECIFLNRKDAEEEAKSRAKQALAFFAVVKVEEVFSGVAVSKKVAFINKESSNAQ